MEPHWLSGSPDPWGCAKILCNKKVCVANPLACYSIGFGPPARMRRKKRKNIWNGLSPKNRKNSRKIGKIARKYGFGAFSYFSAIFPIFWRRPFTIFSLFFSYFGPEARNLFCSRRVGSQRLCSFYGPDDGHGKSMGTICCICCTNGLSPAPHCLWAMLLLFKMSSGNAEGSRNPPVIKFHGRLGCRFNSL